MNAWSNIAGCLTHIQSSFGHPDRISPVGISIGYIDFERSRWENRLIVCVCVWIYSVCMAPCKSYKPYTPAANIVKQFLENFMKLPCNHSKRAMINLISCRGNTFLGVSVQRASLRDDWRVVIRWHAFSQLCVISHCTAERAIEDLALHAYMHVLLLHWWV